MPKRGSKRPSYFLFGGAGEQSALFEMQENPFLDIGPAKGCNENVSKRCLWPQRGACARQCPQRGADANLWSFAPDGLLGPHYTSSIPGNK